MLELLSLVPVWKAPADKVLEVFLMESMKEERLPTAMEALTEEDDHEREVLVKIFKYRAEERPDAEDIVGLI